MKRFIGLIFIFIIGFTLVACNEVTTDLEAVAADVVNIYNGNDTKDSVTNDLTLATSNSLISDAKLVWTSSNEEVITNEGLVNRPTGNDVDVELTLTVTYLEDTLSKIFNLTVKALEEVSAGDFKVTLDGDGLESVITVNNNNDTEVTLKITVPVGYNLDKLLVDDLEVEVINNEYTFIITKDVTAKVTYSLIKEEKQIVTFMINETDVYETTEVIKGNLVIAPKAPLLTNMTFKGWFTDLNMTNNYDFDLEVNNDLVLYAKFEETVHEADETIVLKPVITSNYISMGEGNHADIFQLDPEVFTITKNGNVNLYDDGDFGPHGSGSLKISIADDYVIKEIKIMQSEGGSANIQVTGDQAKPISPNVLLVLSDLEINDISINHVSGKLARISNLEITYATKGPVVTHEVSFNVDGGSSVNKQIVANGKKAVIPSAPTKTDHIFNGWYSDQLLENEFSFDSAIYGNKTLYAKWRYIDPSTIFYNVNFYIEENYIYETIVVEEGFKAVMPTSPTKSGFEFQYWTLNDLVYDFSDSVEGNIDLYAVWEESTGFDLLAYYQNRGIEEATGQTLLDLLNRRLHDGVKIHSYGSNLHPTLTLADEDPNDDKMVNIFYDTDTMKKSANGSGGDYEWNKEHVIPQSWYTGTHGNKGDVHNLRITRASTNSARGSLKFADGSGGWAKTGGGFYPGDGYQGDAARIVMYMSVMLPSTITPSRATIGGIETLRKWHEEDPVDDFEIRRNEILFGYQKNRNPFIDHPEFFELIWGSATYNTSSVLDDLNISTNLFSNQTINSQSNYA